MPFRLYEIVSILKAALIDLEKIEDKDIILVLGNTGCGKSTMLNSLLLGSDCLEETKIMTEIMIGEKVKKRKKLVIATKDDKMTLKIGHSANQSETFFPHFVVKQSTDEVWADIAGFNDTNGEMIETINCLINKIIFNKVRSVRFLVPITHQQITVSRGNEVRK